MHHHASRPIGAAVCAALLVGCGDSRNGPLSPGTLLPETARSAIESIRIDGPSTLTPGATTRYMARAQFADGSERDVTLRTTWESSDSEVLTIVSGGRAGGGKPGQAVVGAEISGQRTSFEVR